MDVVGRETKYRAGRFSLWWGIMDYKRQIAAAFSLITDPEEMELFFDEMLTPKEINDLCMRWQILRGLRAGESQRAIAAKHGMSLCKITRGSKVLKDGNAVAVKLLESGLIDDQSRD
ncbi:unknown protein [Desulfotalea psychrophila LSv54]|uniref:Trp operon repressor n=2 Tax=Desulfotalea psychrophila TaxID=84980 RepID=Q6AIY7_DESPS|nr:unknown protein [Desulfotalea psychrophila LSv54]